MRALLLAAAPLLACSSSDAAPDAVPDLPPRLEAGERLVEGDGYRAVVPSSWRELPDLQPAGTAGTTVGDPRQAVFLSIVHTTVEGEADAAASRTYLAELQKSLLEAGGAVRRWDLEDTPDGLRARATVDRGEMRAEGIHLAVVDGRHVLHGFSADCLSRVASPDPGCERVLSTFDVTVGRRRAGSR